MNSSTPATIRAALEITKGYYVLPDGRAMSDGLSFFGNGAACDDGRNGLDAKIGEPVGDYVAAWNADNDTLELSFAE